MAYVLYQSHALRVVRRRRKRHAEVRPPTGVGSMSKEGRSVLVGMFLTGMWFACCVAWLTDLMLGQRCPWSLELSQWGPRRRLSVSRDSMRLDTSAVTFSHSTDSVSFLAISVGFSHGIVGITGARLP